MTTINLHGLPYTAASPSLFYQVGYPVTIGFDGAAWLIAVRGVWGLREFSTRDEAAAIVATAFTTARENLG